MRKRREIHSGHVLFPHFPLFLTNATTGAFPQKVAPKKEEKKERVKNDPAGGKDVSRKRKRRRRRRRTRLTFLLV